MKKLWISLAVAIAVLAGHASSQSLVSKRLTDTVKQSVGTIDLLKDMNSSQLEAYRKSNDGTPNAGKLVFAVDINENAGGMESSRSQGVAVRKAWLEVTSPNGVKRYEVFSTQTQALIAPEGSTARSTHYTLLGDAGSSRITDRSKIGNRYFDSTLKITVGDDLSAATSAILRIELLKTDASLGDPENFYDETGGYEDLAILVPADVKYFDEQLPLETTFRSEAPAVELSPDGQATQDALVQAAAQDPELQTQISSASTPLSWVAKPGASSYYVVAYEDLYPGKGDYDFNDVVIAYRYQLGVNASGAVERISGEAYLIGRGSNYTHHWSLDIPLPAAVTANLAATTCATADATRTSAPCAVTVGSGRLRWQAFAATRTILPTTSDLRPQRNTFGDVAPIQGPKATFSVTFDAPVPLSQVSADDPWLYVVDTGQSIRLSDRDAKGFPFALKLPSEWRIPLEMTDMGLAYPAFVEFVQSGGTRSADWYARPEPTRVMSWKPLDWAW